MLFFLFDLYYFFYLTLSIIRNNVVVVRVLPDSPSIMLRNDSGRDFIALQFLHP